MIKLSITELAKSISNFQEFFVRDICISNDNKQLKSLMEYGLTILPVNKDGNCFFKSVAINICTNNTAWSHLHVLGNCTPEIPDMTAKLCQIFVDEILGDRCTMYEHFVQPIDDYVTQSKKFLQDRFYNSAIGDLMPVAIATALLANIVIFSTNQDSHPMYVVPMAGCPNGIIFLVYNPAGTGHYDAAVPCSYTVKSASKEPETTHVKTSCSCRINMTKSNTSCAQNPTYATRCKCYHKGLACNTLCKCKECANPYGAKPPKLPTKKRNRHHHRMQVEIPSSKSFQLIEVKLSLKQFGLALSLLS